jgi:hypothetical protein
MTFTRFLKPSNPPKKALAFQKLNEAHSDTTARTTSVSPAPVFRSVRSRPLSRF